MIILEMESIMKKMIILLSLLLILVGCDLLNDSPESKDMMANLSVPSDFDFKTVKEIEVNISLKDRGDQPVPGIFFKVLDKDPDEGGKILAQGATDQAGVFNTILNLPTKLNDVVVIGFMNTYELPIEGNSVTLGLGGSVERIVAGEPVTPRANMFSYVTEFDENGIPIDMEVDYISPEFLQRVDASLPERYPVPDYHPDYLQDGAMLNTVVEEAADVWITFVNEGAGFKNSLGYYTYSLEDGPAENPTDMEHTIIFPNVSLGSGLMVSGDKVYLGQFEAGTVIGWFLVANGWQNSYVSDTRTRFYSNSEYNPETAISYQQHVVLLHDNETNKFLLSFEDLLRPGGDNDFNDAVFYVASNPIEAISTENVNLLDVVVDADDDGVSDLYDDYPDDPERAFDNYYPSEDGWGTLAFEDYWPRQGDYDMNDLVVGYRFHTIHTPNNRLKDIMGTIAVRAIGAAYHNGFAIELPVGAANVSETAGEVEFELDNEFVIVNVFDDAFDVMNPPGEGYVNTDESMEYFAPQTVSFGLTLSSPLVLENLEYQLPYNPFMRKNGDHTKEIHLAGFPPTANADLSIFGTEDDNSNISTGNLYKSDANLPWAINIPVEWQYPKEKDEVTWGYRYFAEWAENAGSIHSDWYIFESENIDESYIYIP